MIFDFISKNIGLNNNKKNSRKYVCRTWKSGNSRGGFHEPYCKIN